MILEQLLEGLATTAVKGPGTALQTDISDVVYDSRKAVEGTLFVCMVGAETDGHKYARNAYDAGCRVFVLEAGHEAAAHLGDVPEQPYVIVVENTRVALAKLSDTFFGHPSGDLKVIGITGTKGKTSITYILQSVLDKAGVPTGLIGTAGASWNGKQVPTVNTTPESYETQKLLRQMADDGVKAVAIEVSSLGVKWHRTDFLEFFCGIFTNISPDHIGGHEHKTYEEYYSFKKAFFSLCGQAAACGDDPAAADMLEAVPGRKIFYGLSEHNEFRAENMVPTRSDDFMGIRFDFLRNGVKEDTFEISLPGDFSVHNALAVLAVCDLMGLDLEKAKEGLRNVRVPGRCQIKYLSKEFGIINASSPCSAPSETARSCAGKNWGPPAAGWRTSRSSPKTTPGSKTRKRSPTRSPCSSRRPAVPASTSSSRTGKRPSPMPSPCWSREISSSAAARDMSVS